MSARKAPLPAGRVERVFRECHGRAAGAVGHGPNFAAAGSLEPLPEEPRVVGIPREPSGLWPFRKRPKGPAADGAASGAGKFLFEKDWNRVPKAAFGCILSQYVELGISRVESLNNSLKIAF